MVVNKQYSHSLLEPFMFFYTIWLLFYIMHWLIGEGMFISFHSVIIIVSMLLFFNLGCLLGKGKNWKSSTVYRLKKDNMTVRKLKKMILVFSTISIIFAIYYLYIYISYFGGFVPYMASDIRAHVTDIPIPLYVRIPLLFSYSLALMSAVFYINYGNLKIIFYASCPIFIAGIAQNGRAGFLMIIFIMFITIILKKSFEKNMNSFQIRHILMRYGVVIAIVGGGFFLIGAAFRYRNANVEDNSFFLYSLKSYLLGGMSAFDIYLQKLDTINCGLGKYNFSSLYDLLGIAKNEYGVYTQYLIYNSDGATTNIFTLFRSLIDDFGLIGGYLFMIVIGILSEKMYVRLIKHDDVALPFMILFYTYLFHSPFLPITVHTSILFSFFIPSIILKRLTKKYNVNETC